MSKQHKQTDNGQTIPFEYLALCPLDGRYHEIMEKLAPYFSEYALMKNRTKVEVYWLKYLIENIQSLDIFKNFDKSKISEILSIYENFSVHSMNRIKEFENGSETTPATKHDVKSVELFVAEELEKMGMGELKSFVHIGCTSEDINNNAYANMIKGGLNEVWIPAAEELLNELASFASKHISTKMLAHTHGQPATPTTIGKEFAVFIYRLRNELEKIKQLKTYGKFNGATGNYAAITSAFNDEDWKIHSKNFVENYLELSFNPITTQIESHDYICEILDHIRHFNNILQGFDRDIWTYISMEYLKQIPVKTEVGSSTMPHKVNPIMFENSESNINSSNAMCEFLSRALSQSRMQRDLTDSSALRNLGLPFGYSLQAINSTTSGIKKITANQQKLLEDLNNKWEVLAEAIQTTLRKYGVPDAYNKLKDLTRGTEISKDNLHAFIEELSISETDKNYLLALAPETYIGEAENLAKNVIDREKQFKKK